MGGVSGGPADRILVGREEELAALEAALQSVPHGRGRAAVVEGPPGIGKSALVRAATAHAEELGLRTAAGFGDSMDRHRPFGILAEAFGVATTYEPDRRGDRARLLEDPLGNPAASRAGFAVAEKLLALVEDWCAQRPLLIVLEDLQWADPATLSWLGRFARYLPGLPLVLLCTVRPLPRSDELDRLRAVLVSTGAREIQLGPLSEPAWRRLAGILLGARPDPALQTQLAGAAGNPLFLTELIGAMRHDGALVTTDGTVSTSESHPASLTAAILRHLSYLDSATRDVLRLAAVLGTRFLVSDLELVTEQTPAALWPAVRDAFSAGLLSDGGDGRLAFRHELIRRVLYEDLPQPVRVGLHRDIASAFGRVGAAADTVAEHLLRASDAGDPRLVADLDRCAARLVASAPATADALWERAVVCGTAAGRDVTDMRLSRALVASSQGELARAESMCRALLHDRRSMAHREGRVRACLASVLLRERRPHEAEREAVLAEAADDLSPSERAYNLAIAATVPVLCGQLDRVPQLTQHAIEASVAARNSAAEARARAIRGHAEHCRGNLSAAQRELEQAAALVDTDSSSGVPESSALLLYADLLIDLDRVAEAEALRVRALHEAESFGAAGELWRAHLIGKNIARATGQFDDAAVAMDVLLEIGHEAGMDLWSYHCQRGGFALYLQGPDAAEPWLHSFDELGLSLPLGYYGASAVRQARAAYLQAVGDQVGALELLRQAWEDTRTTGIAIDRLRLGPDLIAAWARCGRPGTIAPVVDAVDALAVANPRIVTFRAVAARCRGLAHEDPDLLSRAVGLYRRTSRRWDLARCMEAAAVEMARAGRHTEAEAYAGELLDIHDRLGTAWDGARARAALREVGIRPGVRGRRSRPATGWAALTKTEARVAELAMQGLSNPQIAAALVISRRTVRCHLSHVFGKLGIHSRHELAAARAGS